MNRPTLRPPAAPAAAPFAPFAPFAPVALLAVLAAQDAPPAAAAPVEPIADVVAAAVRAIDPARIERTVRALVGFGTRHVLSRTDSETEGTGAARKWLRDEFDALLEGRDPMAVVHTCGSGVTACHNLLAMEIGGLAGSALYAGSWSEWCSKPDRPVARGH